MFLVAVSAVIARRLPKVARRERAGLQRRFASKELAIRDVPDLGLHHRPGTPDRL